MTDLNEGFECASNAIYNDNAILHATCMTLDLARILKKYEINIWKQYASIGLKMACLCLCKYISIEVHAYELSTCLDLRDVV